MFGRHGSTDVCLQGKVDYIEVFVGESLKLSPIELPHCDIHFTRGAALFLYILNTYADVHLSTLNIDIK